MTFDTSLPDYRAILDHSPHGVLLTSPDGGILWANEAACAMLGRTADELRRLGRDAVIDPTDPGLAAALQLRARTGRFAGELTLLRGDGSRFPADVSTRIFLDTDGVHRTSMVILDLSARKRAEAASATATTHLQALVDASPFATIGTDVAGIVTLWNAAAERQFGWTAADVLGTPNPIGAAHTEGEHQELRMRALRGEPATERSLPHSRSDGTTITLAVSTAAVRDRDGQVVGLVSIFAGGDETDARLETAVAAARSAALRQLSLGLRHEMNNALAALSMEAEMLAMGTLDPDARASVVTIVDQARRLSAMLRRLDNVETLDVVHYLEGESMLDLSERPT
jgi:PAS domain S-box-containing protein